MTFHFYEEFILLFHGPSSALVQPFHVFRSKYRTLFVDNCYPTTPFALFNLLRR